MCLNQNEDGRLHRGEKRPGTSGNGVPGVPVASLAADGRLGTDFLIKEVRGLHQSADRLKIGKGILKSEPEIAKKKNYHHYQKSNPKSNYCTICNMNLYDRRYTE